MSDRLEELETELARIANLDLAEQPAAFAALREKLEAQLNAASEQLTEQ
jgi:primosomal protein N''